MGAPVKSTVSGHACDTLQNGSNDASEHVEEFVDAARHGDIDDVKELISINGILNAQDSEGRTALHMAAANGHLDVIRFLISKGADLNARNLEENTPLHWAALNGHAGVVEELILAGANPAALNRFDRTPLDEALSRDKINVVNAINNSMAAVELNVSNINQRNHHSDTA
eukprot:TRINITY_DN1920_c0_g1_i1.p1 TRINITY_DN1920_c0_g1~~TRINITY_DN1920_c0_g1_i1.p1  ORF type:complete len:170 (-),score=46.12 TRINITY_DN1920_c0_g1_i1:247-756(-)